MNLTRNKCQKILGTWMRLECGARFTFGNTLSRLLVTKLSSSQYVYFAYTYTSLLEVYIPFCSASDAVHLIGSFFVCWTSYIPPSLVCRSKPKSAIFTTLPSHKRILRAAKSRWINPLLAKCSCRWQWKLEWKLRWLARILKDHNTQHLNDWHFIVRAR